MNHTNVPENPGVYRFMKVEMYEYPFTESQWIDANMEAHREGVNLATYLYKNETYPAEPKGSGYEDGWLPYLDDLSVTVRVNGGEIRFEFDMDRATARQYNELIGIMIDLTDLGSDVDMEPTDDGIRAYVHGEYMRFTRTYLSERLPAGRGYVWYGESDDFVTPVVTG